MRALCGWLRRFWADEEGSLPELTWVVGAAVVVVLVVVLLMTIAPETTQAIWQRFVNYATQAFRI